MLTVLKILNIKHRKIRKCLDISVDIESGELKKEKIIFLRSPILGKDTYQIEKVKRSVFSSKVVVRLKVTDLPEWALGHYDQNLKENLGTTIFCGISFEDLQRLSRIEKENYFKVFVERFTEGYLKDFYLNNVRTGLRLIPVNGPGNLSLTKIGGHPLADVGFKYPYSSREEPYLFIGQLDIAEMSAVVETTEDIGMNGVLYIFGLVNDDDGYLSFEEIMIKSTPVPESPIEINLPIAAKAYGIFEERSLAALELITVPAEESSLHNHKSLFNDDVLYTQSVFHDYLCPEGFNLLGHPEQVQGCILLETETLHKQQGWYNPNLGQDDVEERKRELKLAASNCKDWRLIFSIDGMHPHFRKLSNLDKEFNEYVDGVYNIMIKEEDLRNGNFENIQTVYTCT